MGESSPQDNIEAESTKRDEVAAGIANAGLVAGVRDRMAASGATSTEMAHANAAVDHATSQAADAWQQEMVNDPNHWVEAETPVGQEPPKPGTEIPDF